VSATDHDAIEEILAGYALGSLSGEDADQADRLLTEHVPACDRCRRSLDAYRGVVADLALEARPVAAPETLLPRLHAEIEPRRGRPSVRLGSARFVAVAASVVLVVGLGGVALTQIGGGSSPPLETLGAVDLQRALDMSTQPGAKTSPLGQVTEITAPGVEEFYIYGDDVPTPPPGTVYRLWAISPTSAEYLGDFLPQPDGLVVLRVRIDPTGFEQLLVTAEPAGSTPAQPGESVWQTAG
jgi:Anti-sigma-K factor rskA, C-terminal